MAKIKVADSNDNFWKNLIATSLCMAVAIGLYKSAPKILDGLAPRNPTRESSSSRDEAGSPGYYNVRMSIPDAVVIVSVRDSPFPEYNKPIGSGVLVSKVVAGKKRLMLLTARHVATTVVNLHGMVGLGLMAEGNTVKNVTVKKALWLADTDTDDDVAVLDITDELEHSSIDLDNRLDVKFATSDRFDEIGIKPGSKAFAVCGNPEKENFTPKAGWYMGKIKPSHSEKDLYVFLMEGIPGNSGSPMFVLENGITSLVGIFSCGMPPENKYAGVVPLDNLIKLLDGRGIPYFKTMNDGASCAADAL